MRRFVSGLLLLFVIAVGPASGEEGMASIYGSEAGSRRADGHSFMPSKIGCAHRTRRLGSIVRVTVIKTGRSISCPINDRGPFTHGLILDLSVGAARALGVRSTTMVRIQ
jgi:rare lipoprotein A